MLAAFALLYSNFREANKAQDQSMIHRYATNEIYQLWKDNPEKYLHFYPMVYGVDLLAGTFWCMQRNCTRMSLGDGCSAGWK